MNWTARSGLAAPAVCSRIRPIMIQEEQMADIREPRMGPWEWLVLLTLSILWGGSFFFTEVALVEPATPGAVLFRVLGGGPAGHRRAGPEGVQREQV